MTLWIHSPYVNQRTVPKLIGLSSRQAKDRIKKAGLTAKVKLGGAAVSAQDTGKVASQDPAAGTKVKPGTGVVTLRCPAAHGEGRLIAKEEGFTRQLMDEGYCAFVYTDAHGRATTRYPDNPNGSPLGVAGLTDRTGRVLGLMPHPDRAYLPHHMPDWQHRGLGEEGEGMVLFHNMVKVARAEG